MVAAAIRQEGVKLTLARHPAIRQYKQPACRWSCPPNNEPNAFFFYILLPLLSCCRPVGTGFGLIERKKILDRRWLWDFKTGEELFESWLIIGVNRLLKVGQRFRKRQAGNLCSKLFLTIDICRMEYARLDVCNKLFLTITVCGTFYELFMKFCLGTNKQFNETKDFKKIIWMTRI